MKEGDRLQLIQQIETLENKIRSGTCVVKAGHKVKGVSDGSKTLELPLTWGQIQERVIVLEQLQLVLSRCHSRRKYYPKKANN